jgi:ferric-dicitrate binding protein FerR (iron transport regulator)
MDDKILNRVSEYEITGGLSEEDAFSKLMDKINSGEKTAKPLKIYNHYYYLTAAASVVIMIGIFFLFNRNQPVRVTAQNGSRIEYRLPDGSQITLNAGSEISFNKADFTKERHLTLSGEAFFEVQKGNKFVISTLNGDVEILGTSLNVISRNDLFKVSCFTGRVLVKSGENSEIITKNESVIKQNNTLVKSNEPNIEKVDAWRKGEFYFDNMALISIFEELERQFNVKVEAVDIEKRFFTGSFSNKNLTETLDILCIPMNLEYEIQADKTITIRTKKH